MRKRQWGQSALRSGPIGFSSFMASYMTWSYGVPFPKQAVSRELKSGSLKSLCAPVEECDDLRTGTISVGTERAVGSAGGNSVLHSPQHRVSVVGVSRHVGERIHALGRGRLLSAPQEGDDLGPGAGSVRAEGGGGGAGGDAVLHGPQHRIIVVSVSLHIGKGVHAALGSRRPGSPPQEGDDLSPGAGGIGAERGGSGAGGDALAHGPDHGVSVASPFSSLSGSTYDVLAISSR